MPQIIDLNELVPDDIIVRYGAPPVDYKLPGDIDVQTVFRLFEIFRTIAVIEGDDPEKLADELKARFDGISAELLKLFQVRNPQMTELPFGVRGIGAVLRVILGEVGVSVSAEDPTPPSPRKPASRTKKPPARRKR